MSRALTNTWPNTKNAEFFKLFGQRIVELTDPRSPDCYRVHALSTTMKLRELLVVSKQVLERQIPKVSLAPILNEVAEALQSDIVIQNILLGLNLDVAALLPAMSETTEEIQSKARLALRLIEKPYQEKCQQLLVENCNELGSKRELLVLCKLYVSYLCGKGFHRRYIFEVSMETFYRQDLGRCSKHVLLRFFQHFDRSKKKTYQVVLSGSERYSSFLEDLFMVQVFEDPQGLEAQLNLDVPENFGQGPQKRIIALFELEGSDPYSIVTSVEGLLELARSFLFLYPSPLKEELDDEAWVFERSRKDARRMISRNNVLSAQRGKSPTEGRAQDLAQNFRDFAFAGRSGRASPNDQLMRALSSAALAGDSSNPETQLVTLWSAFEALLPPPTKDEKSPARIVHFNDLVIPALASHYASSKFAAFYRDLTSSNRKNVKTVLDREFDTGSYEQRLALLLAGEESDAKVLYQIVSRSPLLLNRLYNLHRFAQDPKLALRKISAHEERLSWQVHRIYRERNQIVHSGRASPFLIPLVEHSFHYFRALSARLEAVFSRFGVTDPHGALQLLKSEHAKQTNTLSELGSNLSKNTIEDRRKSAAKLFFE